MGMLERDQLTLLPMPILQIENKRLVRLHRGSPKPGQALLKLTSLHVMRNLLSLVVHPSLTFLGIVYEFGRVRPILR